MDTFMQLVTDLGFILVMASVAVVYRYRGKRAYLAIRFKLQGRK